MRTRTPGAALVVLLSLLAAGAAEAGICRCDCPQCAGTCVPTVNDCGCGFVPQCTIGEVYAVDTQCGPTCGNGDPSYVGAGCPDYDCCDWPSCDECECVAGDSGAPGEPCDDGNFCTGGDVLDDACRCAGTPLTCDDGNPCTNDFCFLFGCQHTPSSNGTPCGDDGNLCNGLEVCQGGDCASTGVVPCDDGDPCTEDVCVPATGCSNLNACGCTVDADCRDASACNGEERCVEGQCAAGEALDCDDGDDCTIDGCDFKFGCTHTTPVDNVCGCVNIALLVGDPDAPSPTVVVDGVVGIGVEYAATPVGYAVLSNGAQSGAVHAATFDDGLHFGVDALGSVFLGAAMEVDADGDGEVDLSVLLGDDLDGGGADVVLASDGGGAEFRLPFSIVQGDACPRVGLGFEIEGQQQPAWWPAGRPGAVQCACGPPAPPAPGSDGGGAEGEGEGGGDGGFRGWSGDPDRGCCRVAGPGARAPRWAILAFAALALRLAARRRRR